MSLFNKPREYLNILKLMREASRRGIEIDDMPIEVVAAALRPKKADPARHGLAPDDELTTEATTRGTPDNDLERATAAASTGQWEPAALLIASTWLDWERRTSVVGHFAELAADDDAWLAAWRKARPHDGDLAVVHAESLLLLAWQIRGSAYATSTSQDQFEGFHRVLTEAEQAAWQATRVLPDDPTPWNTLMMVACGMSYDHDAFGRLWTELVRRAPHHLGAHARALQYWCQKWHGSHELMIDFATRAAASSPDLIHLPLHAAMELENADAPDWSSPMVQRSIDALLPRPDLKHRDRSWLAYALTKSKRYDEAVEQFRHLGTDASGSPWDSWGDTAKMIFAEIRAEACLHARPRR
ncbi:hypothetical protein AB0M36_07485 [Actinoplanes sp. NPDC051346]|uniref:hypothetical protein n=1 Tax=Actinoplanes sp. NPDC051346 TaxID=3155048 RepID=UPI00341428DC